MLQNGRGGSAATVPVMAYLQFAFWVPSRKTPSQQTGFAEPGSIVLQLSACSSSVAYTPVPATVQNTHVETTAVKSQMLQNGRGGSAAACASYGTFTIRFLGPQQK